MSQPIHEIYATRKLPLVAKAYCSTDHKKVIVELRTDQLKTAQRMLVFAYEGFQAQQVDQAIAQLVNS